MVFALLLSTLDFLKTMILKKLRAQLMNAHKLLSFIKNQTKVIGKSLVLW